MLWLDLVICKSYPGGTGFEGIKGSCREAKAVRGQGRPLVKVQPQVQLKAQDLRGHAVFWRCQYHEMTTKNSSNSGVQEAGA